MTDIDNHEHCWCQSWNVAANWNSPADFQDQCCWCGEWRPSAATMNNAAAAFALRHGPHKRYFCGNPNHSALASELEAARKVWLGEQEAAAQMSLDRVWEQAVQQAMEGRKTDPGMETQGFHPCSKCDGRGFIRTLVDGIRDSEPCSYCRMSGRVMEEQR